MKRQLVLMVGWIVLIAVSPASAQLGSRTGEVFEFEEWSLTTPSVAGNPFDLDATATFTPTGGGDPITTGMFYDGTSGSDHVYRFRFTGMDPGRTYNITTASSNADLHGRTGTVTVNANSNPDALGFLVAAGQKHAWQVGDSSNLRPIPKITYARNPETWFWGKDNSPTENLNSYFAPALDQAADLGYDTWWINMRHAWFKWDAWAGSDHSNVNPDLTVFRMLDNHIQDVHDRGLALDIRMWGDSAHNWSAASLPGGINGEEDKRLQKYIADRLGALPGWSLSYAYDLEEFMSESSVDEWADYIYDNLAFPHLIWGRRFYSDSSVTVASNDDRPGDADEAYDDAINRFNESGNKDRPVLFERNFDNSRWSHERVRQGMWAFVMAGGAGAHYADQVAPDVDTFGEFWNGHEPRLLVDMEPANDMSDDSDTWVLYSPGESSLVAYRRDAESIHLDLSAIEGSLFGIAVDTEKDYEEIDLGALEAGPQTIALPYESDWAIHIVPEPTSLALVGFGGLMLVLRRRAGGRGQKVRLLLRQSTTVRKEGDVMARQLIRLIVASCAVLVAAAGPVFGQSGPSSAELFEYAEWHVDNPTYSGNAFDVIADVQFTHVGSGETRTTQMFYDGDDDWRFRFTGTQTGTWNYTTSSGDSDLNGLTGSINVTSNPNAYGFVTHSGNKWARQKGHSGQLEAFVPHFRMGFEKSNFNWSSTEIGNNLDAWMDDEGFNGVHVFMAGYWVNRDGDSTFTNSDPDPRSFDVLEDMINQVRDRGGVTHIWYNGDSARNQSAQSAFGTPGASTAGEQRLLEYIGDRLGAVPGWVMGYGYDNPEHVNTSQLGGWGDYLRDHMAYEHLLGARDQGQNTNYTFWPGADFESRGDWFSGASYNDLAAAFASNEDKPHAFDERWYIGRLGSETSLRRQIWLANMAGGVSTIIGNEGDWEKDPFDNPEYFKTAFTFWDNRFKLDMERQNDLTGGPANQQYALESKDGNLIVIYGEDTDEIAVKLSELAGDADWAPGAHIIAVDTRLAYQEIDLGTFSLTDQSLDMTPHGGTSDWALAVMPVPEPTSLALVALGGLALLKRRRTDVVDVVDRLW
jgi:hypothetical protein